MSKIVIDSKGKAEKELQAIASRFRTLGYLPCDVSLNSSRTGYEQKGKKYMSTLKVDDRGQRILEAEPSLRNEFVAMMNDDKKPLHFISKERYRVSFISDHAEFLSELSKEPNHIMCCFAGCMVYVTIGINSAAIYAFKKRSSSTDSDINAIEKKLQEKFPGSGSVKRHTCVIDINFPSIHDELFSILWCPFVCSNINEYLSDIDNFKNIVAFPCSRQSIFKYFTRLIANDTEELSYIFVEDSTSTATTISEKKTYLRELRPDDHTEDVKKAPKFKWYEKGNEERSWLLDLVTDWWIWDNQFKDNDKIVDVDVGDGKSLAYTLRLFNDGQDFYLEPDWKPSKEDLDAADEIEKASSTPAPAPVGAVPAAAPAIDKTDMDRVADRYHKNRRLFLNCWYEFRTNHPNDTPPSKCSGYWYRRDDVKIEEDVKFCKTEMTSRALKFKIFKRGKRPPFSVFEDDHLEDITYPTTLDHPLCGNIHFTPERDGQRPGDLQVRFGVLFNWTPPDGWKQVFKTEKKGLKMDGTEYLIYNTPIGDRAYAKG